ncbi:MAG: hypothetical protein A2350_15600 [Candidatus Raymondbacteria bacterium RifOxyB12_full_50_8]|nr:MAG: hypothetical protein A2453_06955 [Candidatus Raymondbacteria bacterium RIFOXYC2_FULL_50_21]OGK01111.1 MAG: hypothetical protein A2350_15600 [Candidatus Raymondbacteria bacterium RifOxyB12_full_50_8]
MNFPLLAQQSLPDTYPDIVDTVSNFKMIVQRRYVTAFELRLIVKSEKSNDVKRFAERRRANSEKRAHAMIGSGRQPISGAEQPAIVNGKMAGDLIALIISFQKGDFSVVEPLAITSAELNYRADIASADKRTILVKGKRKTLKHVFVVHSHISWKHRCGGGCGLDYTAKTAMVFDAKGVLLDIETESESVPLSMEPSGK